MTTNIIFLVIGIAAGLIIFYFILMNRAQNMMILEDESKYSLEETEKMILEAAVTMGWKNPANHDLQQTMKNNGFEVLPVKVIEICKPDIAKEILSRDMEKSVSNLMPCRISIYQKTDSKVYISRLNSGLMAKPMKGVIPEVMKKATADIEKIVQPLIKK